MGTALLGDPQVYSSERGEFVSSKHMTLATVISEYDPELSLVFIPQKARGVDDVKPFAIMARNPTFGEQIIRYLSLAELDNPKEILAWVALGDLKKNDSKAIMDRIEAEELAEKLLKERNELEEALDREDQMVQIMRGGRDRRHYYRHDGQTYNR